MRRPAARLAAAAAVAVAVSACNIDIGRGPGPRPAAPNATVGGTARIGITVPLSLDVADADVHDRAGYLVLSTMCDPLIGLDPVSGELTPSLVETWAVDDAGRTINLTLKRDITFSDGSDMSAIDVAHSLTRVASQDQASPVAQLLSPIIGFDVVHGDVPAQRPEQRENLQGVTVVSDRGLQINLTESRANFLYVLTHLALSPVPKAIAEKDPARLRTSPVCAGPYSLEAPFVPGSTSVRLKRSDSYFAGGAVHTRAGRGYLDIVEFVLSTDRKTLAADYVGGRLDAAWLDPADADMPELAADVHRAPNGVLEYIGLPTGTEPFDDPEVRVALSLALDRNALAAALSEGALPATSFLPPTLPEELTAGARCDTTPAGPNVTAAKQLLASAGVALSGKELQFLFNDEHHNRPLMTAAAEQWKQAFGVVPELVGMTGSDYLAASRRPGFTSPFRYGWDGQVPDPDAYLDPIFGSLSTGADNVSKFDNATFDRLLGKIVRKETEDDARESAYGRLAAYLCHQMPMLPVAARVSATAVRSSVLASAEKTYNGRAHGQLLVRELYRTDLEEGGS